MTQVTEQHIISRAAARIFTRHIPPAWTAGEPREGDDYGIDVTLGISASGRMTGRLAHVQVKGVDAGGDAPRVKLKKSTLAYLQNLGDAAMIACIDINTSRLWSIPVYSTHLLQRAEEAEGKEFGYTFSADSESTFDRFFDLIDRWSYRMWWLGRRGAELTMLCESEWIAGRLALRLGMCFPPNIVFSTVDGPSAQFRCGINDGAPYIEDLCSPGSKATMPLMATVSHTLCVLIIFLRGAGLDPLAAEIFAMSAPTLVIGPSQQDALMHIFRNALSELQQQYVIRGLYLHRDPTAARFLALYFNCYERVPLLEQDVCQCFEHSLSEYPDPQLRFDKARILLHLGAHTKAATELALCLASLQFPDELLDYWRLADFYKDRGEYVQADQCFVHCARLGLDAELVAVNRMLTAVEAGDVERVNAVASPSTPRNPWLAPIWCLCLAYAGWVEEHAIRISGETKLLVDLIRDSELAARYYDHIAADVPTGPDLIARNVAMFLLSLGLALTSQEMTWCVRVMRDAERCPLGQLLLSQLDIMVSRRHGGDVLRVLADQELNEERRDTLLQLGKAADHNRMIRRDNGGVK